MHVRLSLPPARDFPTPNVNHYIGHGEKWVETRNAKKGPLTAPSSSSSTLTASMAVMSVTDVGWVKANPAETKKLSGSCPWRSHPKRWEQEREGKRGWGVGRERSDWGTREGDKS